MTPGTLHSPDASGVFEKLSPMKKQSKIRALLSSSHHHRILYFAPNFAYLTLRAIFAGGEEHVYRHDKRGKAVSYTCDVFAPVSRNKCAIYMYEDGNTYPTTFDIPAIASEDTSGMYAILRHFLCA